MLPKEYRLTKKKDFEIIFKQGKSARSDVLSCKILKNNLSESRFGFIVSKKVSGKATVRNKVKRRLRSVIQKELQNIKKSSDIIIIALPGIEKKTFLQTQELVSGLCKKINIIT
jgi:ribonuclease P protein component